VPDVKHQLSKSKPRKKISLKLFMQCISSRIWEHFFSTNI